MIDFNQREKDLSTLIKELSILNDIFLENSKNFKEDADNKKEFLKDNFFDLINEGYLFKEKNSSHPYKITQKGIDYLEDMTSLLNYSRYGE